MAEYKTAYQLERLIAETAGFDPKNIQVTRVGNKGDWCADFVGKVAGVTESRAKHDVEAACNQIRAHFRLEE